MDIGVNRHIKYKNKIESAEYERIKILRLTSHIPELETATVSLQVVQVPIAWQPSRYNGIPSSRLIW